MKKLLLVFMLFLSLILMTSCDVASFLDSEFKAEYYVDNGDGTYKTEEETCLTTGRTELKAYKKLTFKTDEDFEIKGRLITYIGGSFDVECSQTTEFRIKMTWTQGFWYKNKEFINTTLYMEKSGKLEYEVDLSGEDGEDGFKIPSKKDATITILIQAFQYGEEIKDYKIGYTGLEFILDYYDGDVPEDEELIKEFEENNS